MRRLLVHVAALVALVVGCTPAPAPEAKIDLGGDGSRPVGTLVVLDGTKSVEPANKPLAFTWSITARPPGSVSRLANPTLAVTSFRPDAEGTYALALDVSNGTLSARATASFEAKCGVAPPVVTLGEFARDGRVGVPVALAATATDPDAEAPCAQTGEIRLTWTFDDAPAGSTAVIAAETGEKPWFVPDLAGAYDVRATATDSTGLSSFTQARITVGRCGGNTPVVGAIDATAAAVGAPVFLTAAVTDADREAPCGLDDELSYAWRLTLTPGGSTASLVGGSLVSPSFTPDVPGRYGVELVVTDGAGLRGVGSTVLVVGACGAAAPVVTAAVSSPAGPNTGQPVSISATVEDADTSCGKRERFEFEWAIDALPAGSRAVLSDAAARKPWFVPDLPGAYRFIVVATDTTGLASAPFPVVVEASVCGSANPVAKIVAPASAPSGLPIVLRAQVTDADTEAPCGESGASTVSWTFASVPPGSQASFNAPATRDPSFTPDVDGTYVVRLVATDADGHASSPALASITVEACGLRAPVPSASATPEAPAAGSPVQLTATATDADTVAPCALTQAVSYTWNIESAPAGSVATIGAPAAGRTTFTPDLPGEYVVRLTATDSTGRRGFTRLTVAAGACGTRAPSAASTAQPAAPGIGQRVTLSANVSDADDACGAAQAPTYAWKLLQLPVGSAARLSDPALSNPTFVPDVAGSYVAELVVTDAARVASAASRVRIDASTCGGNRPEATVATDPTTPALGLPTQLRATVTDADNAAACAGNQWFSFAWSLLSAPAASSTTLSNAFASAPSFTPDVPGDYAVRLVVTDSTGRASTPVETTITVGPCGSASPVATASASTTTPNAGQSVTLTGSATDVDLEGSCAEAPAHPQVLSFSWKIERAPLGSTARVAGGSQAVTSVTPDLPGRYELSFTVADSTGRRDRKLVTIEAGTCGGASPTTIPAATTVAPFYVRRAVAFAANASDADLLAPCNQSQALRTEWRISELPAGSRAELLSPTSPAPTLTPDLPGTYALQVIATDSTGRVSSPATVRVTVQGCGDNAPTANVKIISPVTAGPASDLVLDPLLSCAVQFDARGSSDPDVACGAPQAPDQLSYRWEALTAPRGSSAELSSTTSATPSLAIDAGGSYSFRLFASDDTHTSPTPATVRVVHKGFSITDVSPGVICQGSGGLSMDVTLTAGGQGFLRVVASDTRPTVTFAGVPVNPTMVGPCTAVPNNPGIETCLALRFPLLVPSLLPLGNYPIAVRNPVANGCAATATFSVGPSPTITTVEPTQVCALDDPLKADDFNLTINGTGFVSASRARLGTSAAKSSVVSSSSRMDAVFDIPLLPASYDVTVSNGSTCGATKPAAVRVLPVPLVFFADPPVIYNGISTQATFYVSALNGPNVTSVAIRPVGSNAPYQALTFTFDPSRPNQVQAVLPKGLPAGDYEAIVTDAATCTSLPVKALTVTGSLTHAVATVDPPFGWTSESTAIDLRTPDTIPTDSVPFTGLPRVYLNPVGGTGIAQALGSVSVVSSRLANAVVRMGLGVGSYDVIVVNPDGAVGMLPAGFRVTQDPPPLVDAIVPGSIATGDGRTVVVRGTNFRTPTVSLDCLVPGGTRRTFNAVVGATSGTEITTTINANTNGIPAGSSCVFTVRNADATTGVFSALGVTTSAENLVAFSAEPSLVTPRRAPAAVSGRPTRVARFLYAVGGDSGPGGAAFNTMEAATLDRFGALGSWRTLPTQLPAARTYATVQRIGRFLYLVGGSPTPTAAPVNTVYRAEVLDPARATTISDLYLQLAENGLTAGLYYYRVAAVLSAADPSNPNGETLASDPVPMNVPTGLPKKLSATLTWSAVPNAAYYRVYRSPAAGAAPGAEAFLARVDAPTLSFTDTGGATQSGTPRRLGDLGEWRTLTNMNVARAGSGLALVRNPSTANLFHLYAISGLTTATATDNSWERLNVAVDPSTGDHTLTGWLSGGAASVPTPRWQTGAWTVDDIVTTRLGAGEFYVHLGPGLTTNAPTSTVSSAHAARVNADGSLGPFVATNAASDAAGYVFAAAANQLFYFGGSSAAPSTGGSSGQLCPTSGCSAPSIKNWNSGISLSVARYLAASAVESARIFAIGGVTTGGQPTGSVESVIW